MPRSNWLLAQLIASSRATMRQRDGRMALRQWPMALNYDPRPLPFDLHSRANCERLYPSRLYPFSLATSPSLLFLFLYIYSPLS